MFLIKKLYTHLLKSIVNKNSIEGVFECFKKSNTFSNRYCNNSN